MSRNMKAKKESGGVKMRHIIEKIALSSIIGLLAIPALLFAGANAPWGDGSKIEVGISIQSGQTVSAWTDRSDETSNRVDWMTPVGDGTYQYQTSLIPNSPYNYIFWAHPKISTSGFVTSTTYQEPVPNNGGDLGTFLSTGSFELSQSTLPYTATGSVGYGSVNGDGRRIMTMPDVPGGTTVYVYNNFASTPQGVHDYTAVASSSSLGGKIRLNWTGGLGYWGTGDPKNAVMDILGGGFTIYKGTGVTSSHPFISTATLLGTATSWTDNYVSESIWYYYIIVASDSYNGPVNVQGANAQLARKTPTDGTYWSDNSYTGNDKRGKPSVAVPVIFKVENMDEDYVEKHGSIVWMTPWSEDGRVYFNKVPGIIVRVRAPRS